MTLAYAASLFPTHLEGFGLVIPKGEHRRVKAFTWVTSKFYGRAPADIVLMRCFIRATAGETDGLSEGDMAEMARAELADILGVAVPPLWSRAYRWDRAMPQYVVGHLERVERIDARLAALHGVRVAGGAYKGSGIPDTVRFSRAQARALLDDLTGASAGLGTRGTGGGTVPGKGEPISLDAFFAGREPESRMLFEAVRVAVEAVGATEIRATKSQVAFRRRLGFAWVWIPGQYLRGKTAPLVLTVDLHRHDTSPRWKEVIEPRPGRFTHHLELYSADQIEGEVLGWLREAWEQAE